MDEEFRIADYQVGGYQVGRSFTKLSVTGLERGVKRAGRVWLATGGVGTEKQHEP
jgi:hypothetical protein